MPLFMVSLSSNAANNINNDHEEECLIVAPTPDAAFDFWLIGIIRDYIEELSDAADGTARATCGLTDALIADTAKQKANLGLDYDDMGDKPVQVVLMNPGSDDHSVARYARYSEWYYYEIPVLATEALIARTAHENRERNRALDKKWGIITDTTIRDACTAQEIYASLIETPKDELP